MRQNAEFMSRIKADKFYPPHVATARFLCRKGVVESILERCGRRLPSLVVEAQAGQGKTTVIKQLLDRLETPSVWYQVGPEDADPVFFLQAILTCLNRRLPDCPAPATARILTGSDFAGYDLEKRVNLLLHDLHASLQDDLYIVFDDLHELIPHDSSLFVLRHLLHTAPPRLHFILASRATLPLRNRSGLSRNRPLVRLGNGELALDEEEVAELFQQVLHLDVGNATIRQVFRMTEGWVMGVLLLGLQAGQQPDNGSFRELVGRRAADARDVFDYFRRDIFAPLEARLHRPLLILALLEEVPVDLARELTQEPRIGADLEDLARRNVFVRQLDPEGSIFGLHHLFRQFLCEKAASELGPGAVRSILERAGKFCIGRDDPAQALRYLVQAGGYETVESVLAQYGMSFLETNRTATLGAILERIPPADLSRQGWSSFFLGLARLDQAPVEALPLLDQALEVFAERDDRTGELLCLAHIISIHITATGDFRDGAQRLARAERLFFETTEALSPSMTILIARSLAMGYGIFAGDMAEATRFGSLGLNLARRENLVNFEAALLLVMGYIQILAGDYAVARLYLEEAATYLHRPEVGTFNVLVIRMMLFDFLFHEGDFFNFFDQKRQLVDAVGPTLVAQSVVGPFCCVLEINVALFRGRTGDALALADQALARYAGHGPHLHSQFLQFQALALALDGQVERALSAAAESRRLRELSGGPYYLAVNKLMVGLVHVYCGERDQGLKLLGEGISDARGMSIECLEACGHLHRAEARLEGDEPEKAGEDLERGLGLMRRNGYRHLWGWTSRAMGRTLASAVSRGIEAVYARDLAAERLGVDVAGDGAIVPRLEFLTLGGFRILVDDVTVLDAHQLTPQQRELLGLLLAAPNGQLPQETVQLHFWPEDPPEAVRIKLDTLLSRLRKTLAEALGEAGSSRYLRRDKGVLWLSHYRLDAADFLAAARRGMRHFKLQERWQAANAFTRAAALWQGEFASGVSGDHRLRAFRDVLTGTLADLAGPWCELLAASGRLAEATGFAEKALRQDPLNDHLNGLLYHLNGKKSAISARKVLDRYVTLLESEDYTPEEIDEFCTSIKDRWGLPG